MLRKLSILYVLFLTTFLCCFADGWQTQEQRLSALNQEITKLLKQKEEYERLKQKIQREVHRENPKIALVLSGGGAKGAAHIGVLRVLEQHHIPIDMIIGTSIGSIVGAMYSIGYSPDEIEKLVFGLKFGKLLTDSKDKSLKTIENSISNEKYPLQLHMDKQMNISAPMGFLNGQNIYFQLKDIFARANGIEDFDKLPIPFRAVSTNLQTGKEEILKNGDLSRAIFSSMAIPAFISPVANNGEYYVDGGVVNNFPVDVAIAMGADIVIGVDITADTSQIDEDSNIVSIIDKISSYTGNRSTALHKQLANILIVPDVKDHNTVNFSNLDVLVKEGENAAHKHDNILKKLRNEERFQEIKNKKLSEKPIYIQNIAVTKNEIISLQQIQSLDPKPKNNLYRKKDLEVWTRKIYANTYVDKIHYQIKGNTIYFDVHEKKAVAMNAGISYTSHYGGSMNITFNVPIFLRNYTNHIGSRIEVSEYPKIDFYTTSIHRFEENSIYGQGKIFVHKDPLFQYQNGKNTSIYSTQKLGVSAMIGTELARQWIIEFEAGLMMSSYRYEKGKKSVPEFKQNYRLFGTELRIQKDSSNRTNFPSEGLYVQARGFTKNSFNKHSVDVLAYQVKADTFTPMTPKISFLSSASFGKMRGTNMPINEYFKIGGFHPFRNSVVFVGMPVYSVLAKEYWTVGAGLQYHIFDNFSLLGRYNYMQYYDLHNHQNSLSGFGAGIGFDTFMGPILFSVGRTRKYHAPIFEITFGYHF